MKDLVSYLSSASVEDQFKSSLSPRGGYITFSNSGRRGESKQFQIGLDSIIATLHDIKRHTQSFVDHYDEKAWRDAGTIYFSDPVANAIAASQTKPIFVVLSKLIKWANEPFLDSVNTSNHITLDSRVLDQTIFALDEIASTFEPKSLTPTPSKEIVLKRNNQPLQQIFYGAPGTGKSFAIDAMADDDHAVRTTFHPDSDYASFVGAYKPTMENVDIHYISEGEVKFAKGGKNDKSDKGQHPGTERKIVYKYVPQAFLKAYVAAWKDLSNPYYLVIEEINRGNCAQIFGDLFQLLDRNNTGSSSYAIHADNDIRHFLESDDEGFGKLNDDQKDAIKNFILYKDNGSENPIGKKILSGELLLLPPNLHIWATMNTSDQSLFPIDSAFKRRWNWEYVPIEYDKKNWLLEVGGNRYRWGDFLAAINPIIYDLTDSTDKQMGYFFAKPDKKSDPSLKENDIISEKLFLNKVLFYLWTDVLKDYDVSEEPFIVKGSDPQRTYRFTDFFDKGHSYLEEFISKDKLGLKRIEEKDSGDGVEEIEDYLDSYVEDAGQNSPKSLGRYTINGTGSFFMGPAVVEVMKLYISQNPELTAAAIVANWSDFRYPKVYLAHQYEAKKAISKDSRIDNKHTSFDLPNGEKIYISIGFVPETMAEFIRILDSKDWGITIRKIN